MKHAKGMKRTMLLMTLALLLFGARAEALDVSAFVRLANAAALKAKTNAL